MEVTIIFVYLSHNNTIVMFYHESTITVYTFVRSHIYCDNYDKVTLENVHTHTTDMSLVLPIVILL
jgi:hypothetical protein